MNVDFTSFGVLGVVVIVVLLFLKFLTEISDKMVGGLRQVLDDQIDKYRVITQEVAETLRSNNEIKIKLIETVNNLDKRVMEQGNVTRETIQKLNQTLDSLVKIANKQ